MDSKKCEQLTLLYTRIVLALIFFLKGFPKIFQMPENFQALPFLTLPGFFLPLLGVVEVVGAAMLILGLFMKQTNYVLGFIILVATLGTYLGSGYGTSIERNLLMLAGHSILIARGPGKFGLN